jgi:hypothetical protein
MASLSAGFSPLCEKRCLYGRLNGACSDRSTLQSGRADPSGANVVGCHVRSLRISRIHARELSFRSLLEGQIAVFVGRSQQVQDEAMYPGKAEHLGLVDAVRLPRVMQVDALKTHIPQFDLAHWGIIEIMHNACSYQGF